MNNTRIITELKRISRRSNGVLLPEKVIEAARPKSSPLHNQFCWDDTEAAHQFRLWQAQKLIRTTIHWIEINGDKRPVRAFVSLTPDRTREGGGYRDIVTVLSDKDMRRQMLKDALDELQLFEAKYAHLKELAGVFTASKLVRQKLISLVAA